MRQAAFLRAINVGTHNRIKMAALREVCLAAGLKDVVTYLQTGNLLFESPEPPESVASIVEDALVAHGLRNAAVIVRSQDELGELLRDDPFGDFPVEQFTRYVTLFRYALPENAAEVSAANPANVLVREREVCSVLPLERPPGIDVNGGLEKKLKMQGTTRYWHVVQEMERMLRGD